MNDSPYSSAFHARWALRGWTVTGTLRATGRYTMHPTTRRQGVKGRKSDLHRAFKGIR